MKPTQLRDLPASLGTLCLLVLLACAGPSSSLTEAHRTAIGDTIATLAAITDTAISPASCLEALTVFGDREPLVASGGTVIRTRRALEQKCASTGSGIVRVQYAIAASNAHVLSRDAAYLVREGTSTLEFADGPPIRIYLVTTGVWVRGDTGWKRAHYHESWRELDAPSSD